MGGLFSLSKNSLPNIYINLEKALPKGDNEREVFNDFMKNISDPSASIFSRFSNYKDGKLLIANSLTNPTPENKETAWETVYPNILLQMEVYSFAKTVTEKFTNLIHLVLKLISEGTTDVFEKSPAITRCFAECFDIILRFDEIKLTLPGLLNDLAFFRRNAASHNFNSKLEDVINNSNYSTIFWAAQSPMLNDVIEALRSKYKSGSHDFEMLLKLLGSVADICTSIAMNESSPDAERAKILCLRCVVGSTLIIDHLNPEGAFLQNSFFHVREGMEFLVGYTPRQTGLISTIMYSSKHLNDPDADPKIKQLLQI
ncbi:DUF1394-domain-containing protein [Histomonas meleagridis]|uniref:DUF1394-domain-containing protein n=1 Tax=Histomonas meleagridis TaxID=135588 RepID=UPI00355A0B7B|nr:DUF1394-domain-containing protein [Histomonas meleagridis]KAH0806666.1 DUF1394-domain-containing protein [Histomonas meleagridis]